MKTLIFLVPFLTDYRALAEFAHECVSLGILNASFIFLLVSVQLFRRARRQPIVRG